MKKALLFIELIVWCLWISMAQQNSLWTIQLVNSQWETVWNYSDLSSAIDAANNKWDIIKITEDLEVMTGVDIMNKEIIIDWQNHTLTRTNDIIMFTIHENSTWVFKDIVIQDNAINFYPDRETAYAYTWTSYAYINIILNWDSPRKNPQILSNWNLLWENLTIKNSLSSKTPWGIIASSWSIIMKDSSFVHNWTTSYAWDWWAIRLWLTSLTTDIFESPLKTVEFINCKFESNYWYRWWAIVWNILPDLIFDNCVFTWNTAYNKWWAIWLWTISNNLKAKNLPLATMTISNSIFFNNRCWNDGFAIDNSEMWANVTNTKFIKNIWPAIRSQSVWTYSAEIMAANTKKYRDDEIIDTIRTTQYFDNCVFQENEWAVASIWDHGTPATFVVKNTEFIGNKWSEDVLLYYWNSWTIFENITFTQFDNSKVCVYKPTSWYCTIKKPTFIAHALYIDSNLESEYDSFLPNIKLNNVKAENAIVISSYYATNPSKDKRNTIYLNWDIKWDIVLWSQDVDIDWNLDWDLYQIRVWWNSSIPVYEMSNWNINIWNNWSFNWLKKYSAIFYFNWQSTRLYLTWNITYSLQDFQNLLWYTTNSWKIITRYTDDWFQNLWSGIVDDEHWTTVYWQEEDFPIDKSIYILDDTKIHVYSQNMFYHWDIDINLPESLVYDWNNKLITLSSDSISDVNWNISYFILDQNDNWVTTNDTKYPWKYKAQIIFPEDKYIYYYFDIQEVQPSWWYSWWGRRKISTTTPNSFVETQKDSSVLSWANAKDLENTIPMNSSSETSDPEWQTYTQEFQEAYKFAYEKWITTMPTINDANMNWKLTRIAMAKMLSYYAINVLWQKPDETRINKFNDITDKLDAQYDSGVTLAYQLWIMWINMPDNMFKPNDEVTRAEFATALSRMLYSTPDGKPYYVTHLEKLKAEKILTNDDYKMKELRWYVMIMLMRSAK